jgi:hypothetical protein
LQLAVLVFSPEDELGPEDLVLVLEVRELRLKLPDELQTVLLGFEVSPAGLQLGEEVLSLDERAEDLLAVEAGLVHLLAADEESGQALVRGLLVEGKDVVERGLALDQVSRQDDQSRNRLLVHGLKVLVALA